MCENYSQTSARRTKPRFWPQARALAFNAKGGEPAEPVAERHPQCDPSENLTIAVKQSVLADDVKSRTVSNMSLRGESVANDVAIPLSTRQCLTGSPRATALAMTRAFTMAEILLSLTIIGVVAAITLPSLTGNINERTWNTQRKALYARFSQAIALMPALNGYGKVETDSAGSVTADNVAETFITAGLSKVLKINNICDADHLADCGVPEKMTNLGGSLMNIPTKLSELNSKIVSMNVVVDSTSYSYSQEDTKAAAFETANGETVITYYNPYCQSDMNELSTGNWYYAQNKVCVNFVYDLNGNKGPNTVGKDIGFISALYPTDAIVVAPFVVSSKEKDSVDYASALAYCTSLDQEYRLPNINELTSMFFNQELMNIYDRFFWSSTVYNSQYVWMQSLNIGRRILGAKSRTDASAVCVKRN